MRSLFSVLDALMPPLPFAAARQAAGLPLGRGGGDLIVLTRTTKMMRAARLGRDGRRHPAVSAPLLICTHRPTGKTWPRHRTNRVRKAVA